MKSILKTISKSIVQFAGYIKNSLPVILRFFKRLKKSALLMSKTEMILSVSFLICALLLLGVKAKEQFVERTKMVPDSGGTYVEAVYGDFKHLNPLLASTDAEKASSKLVFSGLVKYDKDNNVIPDLAEKWEVSQDNLRYTFYLRDDVMFHNGDKLTGEDIISTLEKIKAPAFKSPLSSAWADVNITSEGSKIIFDLPRAYGPFIYNCDFGILPFRIPDEEFNKKLIGTGPYKFANSSAKSNKIVQLNLESNNQFYEGQPFISKIELNFFGSQNETELAFKEKKTNAISGMSLAKKGNVNDLSFKTTKRLGLILNIRKDKLKDKTVRQKILGNEKLTEKL